ncbi:uncharacterized protein EKO05_0006965 [Ascochyta rabiei]|uniref:uncharacterized protein n=1 Tax=Didymella rabiei TaxID=5454 RepID=UPI0021FA5674|nr:uncharacterized protein EKO05_0006965 [Ascochyta rabiei]UPX16573.1 hypothetical protein EKO05_0006965 [Ascochyta rabiei]
MAMAKHPYDDPDPVPIYLLLILAILLCAYFGWVGSVAVRLYFYKGALGPEPERFVILPVYLRDRSPQRGHHRRVTAFPIPTTPKSPARELARLSRVPRIDSADVDANELPDSEIHAFFAEQQRISRLPAFVQDDCGDGSDFPNIPFAVRPVDGNQNTLAPLGISRRPSTSYKALGLEKLEQNEWLAVDDTYKDLHAARDYLLAKKNAECIQVKHDGEAACEELLEDVVKFLVSKYPDDFSIQTINRRRHIRNEITREEWSLVRPFDCHPLEVCARLAAEDFNILLKGEFTQQHYLATLFPAGWHMRSLIGKPLSHMQEQDLHQWNDIPSILAHITSTSTSTSTPLSRTTLYIQTHPDTRPLSHTLFTQAPQDLFPGNLSTLLPQHILVRREQHIFRRLRSGAVVFSTRTRVQKLTDLNVVERRALVKEVRGWEGEIAVRKGVELWQRIVLGWCEGKKAGI